MINTVVQLDKKIQTIQPHTYAYLLINCNSSSSSSTRRHHHVGHQHRWNSKYSLQTVIIVQQKSTHTLADNIRSRELQLEKYL